MKTLHFGLTLAVVLAARWTLGQETPPADPPADTPPAEPAPSAPPTEPTPSAPPAETPPPVSEAPPAPSETPPAPPAPTGTAEFPAPPPPAPTASSSAPAASPSTAPPIPPPVPPPDKSAQQAQSKRVDELAKKEKEVEGKDETHGIFGPFRIGPVIGVGLPAFFTFGGAVKLTKYFGAGLNYGIVPQIQFDYYGDATVRYQGVNIYGHIHPLGGGFFLGAGIGYAHVRGTYDEEFTANLPGMKFAPAPAKFAYTSEATMQTLVLTPDIGYFFTFKSGFTVGVESGIQIPIAPSEITFQSKVDLPPQWEPYEDQVIQRYIAPTDARVEDTLERVGQTILPTIGIKIGWLF